MSNQDHYNKIYSENKRAFGMKADDLVIEIPQYVSVGSVMDLGAGEGRNAMFLARQGFEVTAVDVSEVGLAKLGEVAQVNGLNIITHVQDINNLNLDRDFDIFLCIVVLHNLPRENAIKVIREMQRHTTPNGLNILRTFTQKGDFYELKKGVDRFYVKDGELKDLYEGWEILKYEEEETQAITKRPNGSPMTNISAKLIARKITK